MKRFVFIEVCLLLALCGIAVSMDLEPTGLPTGGTTMHTFMNASAAKGFTGLPSTLELLMASGDRVTGSQVNEYLPAAILADLNEDNCRICNYSGSQEQGYVTCTCIWDDGHICTVMQWDSWSSMSYGVDGVCLEHFIGRIVEKDSGVEISPRDVTYDPTKCCSETDSSKRAYFISTGTVQSCIDQGGCSVCSIMGDNNEGGALCTTGTPGSYVCRSHSWSYPVPTSGGTPGGEMMLGSDGICLLHERYFFRQVNEDGFGIGPSDRPLHFLNFDGDLFAWDDNGLFLRSFQSPTGWYPIPIPPQCESYFSFHAFGGYLYLYARNEGMWFVESSDDLGLISSWHRITAHNVGDTPPIPVAYFGGYLYGVYWKSTVDSFDIWRTSDVGNENMVWDKVVSDGFGDPANNHDLAFMIVYNGKLLAVTTYTRTGAFGDSTLYGSGVEVWQSATGDAGSWKQINQDGFGSNSSSYPSVRINQDAGCWAIYDGLLYIGTKAHFGGEVWTYNGQGTSGWTNVTPVFPNPLDEDDVIPLGSGPVRNEAMVVYQGSLYLAQGFPTGNLARRIKNGTWQLVVPGPGPFSDGNYGFSDLAVYDGMLYAATIYRPSAGLTNGHQVWAYPFHD